MDGEISQTSAVRRERFIENSWKMQLALDKFKKI